MTNIERLRDARQRAVDGIANDSRLYYDALLQADTQLFTLAETAKAMREADRGTAGGTSGIIEKRKCIEAFDAAWAAFEGVRL